MTNIITNLILALSIRLATNGSLMYGFPSPACAICGASHHDIKVTKFQVLEQRVGQVTWENTTHELLLSSKVLKEYFETNEVAPAKALQWGYQYMQVTNHLTDDSKIVLPKFFNN